ncbi:DUF202 domain-containing protein [Actinokineospora enzanensis]|uniref:DUF202 domain-containing protein n=1 Tax=Actinokineospora enzanensis TaxID=155975 RepID=UPI000367B353|nr:DUF202 domain-containing protein [Actinokineospora enzanensis]
MSDRGLQAERTRLAWTRTGFSAAGVGALLLHGSHGPFGMVCGGLIVLCALGLVLCGSRRYRDGLVRTMPWWVGALVVLPGLIALIGLLGR